MVATIFGAGFIGRAVIGRLAKSKTQLVVAYRGSGYDEEKLMVTGDLGQIYFSHYNLKDEDSLYKAMEHSEVVVNCIGKLNETKNFSFDDVHVEGPRRMARIARELGVKKFIHLSTINASPNPKPVVLRKGSKFLRSKYYGELAVREEFPDAIIFRPSDVLGESDHFMNHYTYMQRALYTKTLPIWDYYFDVEKQPVWQADLISGIEAAIKDDSANGRTFQAVGPYRYNFYDLIEYMRSCSGQGQKNDTYEISNMRWNLMARLMTTIGEYMFKYPPLTWERVEKDSLSDFVDPSLPTLEDLGVKLTPLEMHIHKLGYYVPRYMRVEIPFESQAKIDKPTRLNAAIA